ncbi:MAG: hypothetical protein JNM82_07365 [Rhodocyclaceae bacterium]|nr:hypothetical protein [Rhodocyclaceae bacterium]
MGLPGYPLAAAAAALLLAACASAPTGPGVMALPGTGKSFEQFRADDADCRQFAFAQSGAADPAEAGVRSAAVGTVVGAVAGAAIGGRDAAGVGAGTGLIVGSMAGSGSSRGSAYDAQRLYDNAYVQCMYAKGQQVPVSGALRSRSAVPAAPEPAPAPAPGPGAYPPPPPRTALPSSAAQQFWYRCANPAGYYPYVTQCLEGWQRVPASPPAAPAR